MIAEQLTDAVTVHGEGAVWNAELQRLLFVDMLAGDVLTLLPTGSVTRRHVGDVAAIIRPRRSGGHVVAVEHHVLLFDEFWRVESGIRVISDPGVRLNEGGCDPQGRFYCGSMAYDVSEGVGAVYRFDGGPELQVVRDRVSIPNGLVWDASGEHLFHNETVSGTITRFDFDAAAGTWHNPEVIHRTDDDASLPDGSAIDDEGRLWVAQWGGGAVLCISPEGVIEGRVEVPGAGQVTSCAFGGPDMSTLFITTSSDGLDRSAHPRAGALFVVDPGVSGPPVHTFDG